MDVVNKQQITIDLRRNSIVPYPHFTQYDTNTLEFIIKDNGIGADLSNVTNITVNYKRPDGQVVTRLLTAAGNVIEYTLGTDEMSVPGTAEISLQFLYNDNRLSTRRMKLYVGDSLGPSFEGGQGMPLLQELFVEIADLTSATNDAANYALQKAAEADQAKETALEAADLAKTNPLMPVANFAAIATTYPTPIHGDETQTLDDGKVYRYLNGSWEYIRELTPGPVAALTQQLVQMDEQKASKEEVANALDGSPKDVFATLAALQTAFPTGSQGVYLVTANGHIYSWDGTSWADRGLYQAQGIADKSVGYKQTDFIEMEKTNLFNPQNVTDGVRLDTAGNNFADATFATSEYVAVKAGVPIKIGGFGAVLGRICLYDTNKTFTTMPFGGGTVVVTLDITPAVDGFIRVPVRKDTMHSAIIVESSNYKGFKPFRYVVNPYIETEVKRDSVDKTKLKLKAVAPENTSFVRAGVNMYSVLNATPDVFLTHTNGVETALVNYRTSEYIFVKANLPYIISAARKFVYYDLEHVYVSGVDGSQSAPYTFTPTADGYIRFSYLTTAANGTNVMMVQGNTLPATYEPHVYHFDDLKLTPTQINEVITAIETGVPSDYDVKVVKAGESYVLYSPFGASGEIQINTVRNGSKNGTFNFANTRVGADEFHLNGDDITPVRTNTGTVGANHGRTSISEITMAAHGKTSVDIGSTWTDGTTTFTLLKINGNILTFGCPYTVVDGIVNAPKVNPVANLTHVSGATSTTAVNITTQTASPQLYPSVNNITVEYILDGKKIVVDGTYYGKELVVKEKYDIMDYKAIIDYAQANIGQSYAAGNIAPEITISNTFTYSKGLDCSTSNSLYTHKKASLGRCGFLQAGVLSLAGHTVKRHVPGVLPKSGIDFSTEVDLTSYNTSLLFSVSDYKNPSIPPNHYVDWLYDANGNKKYGFAMGYIVDKTSSKNAARLANSPYTWDMRNTKKSYPIVLEGIILEAGSYLNFAGFRNYVSPDVVGAATLITTVRDKKDTYVYVDYLQTVVGENKPMPDDIGKAVSFLQGENFTLLNDTSDTEGVLFTMTGAGYGIVKLK
ncbi:BppU family phage baseplate upper protein [Domibacillus aminovorans]|uniref:BppU N-terminal domain-containing protein n=1 Tax=Domibacillus aminovorans TaxID=29332 RepID=A0A177L7H1_9BACI|nr:BppU family phage baseplate upper protein [Domibacillus aminovorans]OAH60651.1 hypothetical protein AWH49_15570 [Domibacillus aminovorans]